MYIFQAVKDLIDFPPFPRAEFPSAATRYGGQDIYLYTALGEELLAGWHIEKGGLFAGSVWK